GQRRGPVTQLGGVGAFDPSRGTYTPIVPRVGSGYAEWVHPGDVTGGPDRLLYVLNNGRGRDGLYVMTADGQVVRQVALNANGSVSLGVHVGEDGSLYVSHTDGG